MRRAAFVLASGVAAAIIAAALLYDRDDSSPSSAAALPRQTDQPQETPSAATEQKRLDSAPTEEAVAQTRQPPSFNVNDEIRRQRRPQVDEATVRAQIREQATKDVREGYALLLEDLALPEQQETDLLALLIDMQVEQTWAGEIRGRTISDQEKYERIAAVLGDRKLVEFIALEENLLAYWEATQIARLMRRKQLPLTDEQLDGVFDIVVEVRARYPYHEPPADIDSNSDDWIEHHLAQLDEFDRHVVELAPSVLSPTQVGHLSNAYDFMSQDRLSMVELQRKRRADGDPPLMKFGWSTPGRWQ